MGSDTHRRWSIEDILARTDLTRLLDELAEPAGSQARGRRWHCPVRDHQDHNASVTMFTDGRGHERWRCWSGDDAHRGDAIDLVMVTSGRDRAAAIEHLAGRAGLSADTPAPTTPRALRSRPTPSPIELDPAVIRYVEACEKILWSSAGRPMRQWLTERGLGADIVRANRVGADPSRTKLRRNAGLPYGAQPGVTFPALDQRGAIRYVQTRYLEPNADSPKYDNPASRLGSNPRLAWTTPVGDIRPELLVVCEGIPDALTAAQAGCLAVGVLGSQYPDASVATRLAARADHDGLTIVGVTDADDAGRKWGDRLGELLVDHGQTLHVLEPPGDGLDLNDWAQRDPDWATWLPNPHPPATPEVTPRHLVLTPTLEGPP